MCGFFQSLFETGLRPAFDFHLKPAGELQCFAERFCISFILMASDMQESIVLMKYNGFIALAQGIERCIRCRFCCMTKRGRIEKGVTHLVPPVPSKRKTLSQASFMPLSCELVQLLPQTIPPEALSTLGVITTLKPLRACCPVRIITPAAT